MHQELGSGPHHCSSDALIYYPVCLHSYLRPCPPSPSIKHTHRHTTHTSAHWLSAPCLPGHWETCIFTYSFTFASALTHLSLHPHTLPWQRTLTCVVQMVNSPTLLFSFHTTPSLSLALFLPVFSSSFYSHFPYVTIPKRTSVYKCVALIKSSLINISQYV